MSIYTVTFGSTYTNAVDADIGKTVVQGASTGTLIWYDNTAKKWRVDSASFATGVTTITSGTGAGTSTTISSDVPVSTGIKGFVRNYYFVPYTKFVWLTIVKTSVTVIAQVSLVGAEISVYELDNSPTGSLGTQIQHDESCATSSYVISQLSPGNLVWIQIMLPGYIEYGAEYTIPSANTTIPILLKADLNT